MKNVLQVVAEKNPAAAKLDPASVVDSSIGAEVKREISGSAPATATEPGSPSSS